MDLNINYASNIEFLRIKRGFSKKDLYAQAGFSKSSFLGMMSRNSFSTKALEKIAQVLNVHVADLVKSDHIVDPNNMIKEDFEKIEEEIERFKEKHIK